MLKWLLRTPPKIGSKWRNLGSGPFIGTEGSFDSPNIRVIDGVKDKWVLYHRLDYGPRTKYSCSIRSLRFDHREIT